MNLNEIKEKIKMSKEEILSNVLCVPMNTENIRYKKEFVQHNFLDIVIVYACFINHDALFYITNNMLEDFQITEGELLMAAINNTMKKKVETLCICETPFPMYVMQMTGTCFGASAMFALKNLELPEILGDDIFILPSSMSEIILVNDWGISIDALKEMVVSVNMEDCVGDLKLSDNVYKYNRQTGVLCIA